jgi:type IV pilus assembly protein PilB
MTTADEAEEIADALARLVAAKRAAGTPRHTGRRLGTLLVLRGYLMQSEVDAALRQQAATNQRLGEILVANGYISERDLVELLAEQLRMSMIDLQRVAPDPTIVPLLSRADARRLAAVPIRRRGDTIEVAVADPTDSDLAHELGAALQSRVQLSLAPLSEIDSIIDRLSP